MYPGHRPFLHIGSSRLSPSSPAQVPPPTRSALQLLAIRLLQCMTRPSSPSAQIAATLIRPQISSSTVPVSTSALSYAAVTLLGVHPTGSLVLSTPAPAIQVCSSVHSLHCAFYTPPPLPWAASTLLRFCLSHQLRDGQRPDLLSAELVGLVGSARKPSTICKHTNYFAPWISFMSQRNLPPLLLNI